MSTTVTQSGSGAATVTITVSRGPAGPAGPAGPGSGDVSGPASAVSNNFAAFDGTGGKTIKDSGSSAASFAAASHNHSAADITSGTINIDRLPIGSSELEVAPGDHTHAGVYQPVGSYATLTGTETLTNKRTPPRVTTIVSSGTPTVNSDNCDMVTITAQAEAITSMTSSLTGTPNNGEMLLFRIKDDGTARAITWGASFEANGAALPTTTVISKRLTALFQWDSVTSKWGCLSTSQEA